MVLTCDTFYIATFINLRKVSLRTFTNSILTFRETIQIFAWFGKFTLFIDTRCYELMINYYYLISVSRLTYIWDNIYCLHLRDILVNIHIDGWSNYTKHGTEFDCKYFRMVHLRRRRHLFQKHFQDPLLKDYYQSIMNIWMFHIPSRFFRSNNPLCVVAFV